MTAHTASGRWLGVGHTMETDPASAGAAAVAAATGGRSAALLMVFCSVDQDHERLLEAVRLGAVASAGVSAGPGPGQHVAIVGCSTGGQVVGGSPYRGPGGVLVLALGGEGLSIQTTVARNASEDRRVAGMTVAGCLDGIERPHRVGLLLADGLIGEQHELLRGAYSVVGAATALVGGCAGDDYDYGRTVQFHGDQHGVDVFTDAVVGVGLGSEGPLGVGIAHGWRKAGEPMVVTSSSGGRIATLDEEPALDVYLRRIGGDRSLLADPATFRRTAFTRPLGMSRRTGEDIRVIHRADPDDGSLVCLADVPQGALAWVMETDPESLVLGAKESVTQAIAELGGADPIGLVTFDCGARRAMLGEEALEQEVAAMAAVLGDIPFGGFYTCGEIARTHGARGMHHLTVVSLAIG